MDTVLILRTCDKDGKSYGGFQWSLTVGATVTAPDWSPTPECGHGLHGALWGEGDGSLFNWSPDAVWMVVEADAFSIVELGGKVKFPSCVVRYVGNQASATAFLASVRPGAIIGGTATAGYRGTATAGYRGTATAGEYGTATAGEYGTATAGTGGTATAGDRGTLVCKWWDVSRSRIAVAYVGENGIKPNTPYRVNERGEFVEVVR